jgi:hypothetical protein
MERDWDQHLAVVEFAINNSYHSGIRNPPLTLNYGQHPLDPVLARLRHKNPAVSKFLGNWEEQVSKAKTFYAIGQQRYKQYMPISTAGLVLITSLVITSS